MPCWLSWDVRVDSGRLGGFATVAFGLCSCSCSALVFALLSLQWLLQSSWRLFGCWWQEGPPCFPPPQEELKATLLPLIQILVLNTRTLSNSNHATRTPKCLQCLKADPQIPQSPHGRKQGPADELVYVMAVDLLLFLSSASCSA